MITRAMADNPLKLEILLNAHFHCAYQLAIFMACAYCTERIGPHDLTRDGANERFHAECLFRAVAGSAAHLLGDCSCCGGTRGDPPGMTLRQSAVLAWDTYSELHPELRDYRQCPY